MAYSTLAKLKKRITEAALIQLTDDENGIAINESRVDEALAAADAVIDGHCRGRYTVPFIVVPDMIAAIAEQLAIYNLYARKVEEMPQTRDDQKKDAMELLKAIATGKITIGEPDADVPEVGGVQTNTTANDRIFTKDLLKGF